jgi:hypothetical protein
MMTDELRPIQTLGTVLVLDMGIRRVHQSKARGRHTRYRQQDEAMAVEEELLQQQAVEGLEQQVQFVAARQTGDLSLRTW